MYMKKLRLRIANNVDIGRTFTASIKGGTRGYSDACAIETHSNTEFPTVKTMGGFMVVGIMREDDEQ